MGLFKKNKNEAAYVGGKKHFADVIKNTGDGELLVWRQPEEDFNDGSTLIVMPGEEAVFIKGGVIEQVFSNGTYSLSTENYPFISRLRNARTGGVSVFNCVVFFIKTALSIEVKWGTSNPVEVLAKVPGSDDRIKVDVQSHGSYKLKISNSGIFLTKLLGSNIKAFSPAELDKFFFEEFQGIIVDGIASVCSDEEDIRNIAKNKSEIQKEVSPHINKRLAEYGVYCENFAISHISAKNPLLEKIDTISIDLYEQERQGDVTAKNTVKQGQAEAQVKLRHGLTEAQIIAMQGEAEAQIIAMKGQAEAQIKLQQGLAEAQIMIAQGKAQKEVMDALGEHGWTKQQSAEILETLAGNSGAGGLAATGAGLGLGMAMSGPFAGISNQFITSFGSTDAAAHQQNSSPASVEENGAVGEDPVKKLTALKKMLDADLISADEYNDKKKEILAKM